MPTTKLKRYSWLFKALLVAAILTAAAVFLFVYLYRLRHIPAHARFIPAESFTVVTVNTRGIAEDLSEDFITSSEKVTPLMKRLADAAEKNGGSGLDLTDDILFFAYRTGDAAFAGAVVAVNDSARFRTYIDQHITREFDLRSWSTAGVPVMRFDTTPGVIGWNASAAVLLYPISNHGIAQVSAQCIRLLTQSEDQSLLSNKDFTERQERSFDINIWFQCDAIRSFTGGGQLVNDVFAGCTYTNTAVNFEEGEILLSTENVLSSDLVRPHEEIKIPCDIERMKGLVRTHYNLTNDAGKSHFSESIMRDHLPFSDEEVKYLSQYLSGENIWIMHPIPSASRSQSHISSQATPDSSAATDRLPFSASFKVKDGALLGKYISERMNELNILPSSGGWSYMIDGQKLKMILTQDLLTVTNDPTIDGRPRNLPVRFQNDLLWLETSTLFYYITRSEFAHWYPFIPEWCSKLETSISEAEANLPLITGNRSVSECRIQLKNKDANALQNLLELYR